MLGGTIPDEDDNDVIAEQLAKISEQMAIKNRRSKKIWKIAGVIFLVIVLLNILLIPMLGLGCYKSEEQEGVERMEIKSHIFMFMLFRNMKTDRTGVVRLKMIEPL